MAEVTDDFVEKLKSVRGEFQNTSGGRIGNKILAHIFSTVFPIFFVGYLFLFGNATWPWAAENWLFLGFGILTLSLGLVLHKTVNSRFIFDDDGVHEHRQNGSLKNTILWTELIRVDFMESRGIKSFRLMTESESMLVEYYKDLSDAIAEIQPS